MLNSIPVALATASLLVPAPPPVDAVQAIDLPRLAKPLNRTPGRLPGMTAVSLNVVLRLFLYWGVTLLLRNLAAAAAAEARTGGGVGTSGSLAHRNLVPQTARHRAGERLSGIYGWVRHPRSTR
jgi:protein-S-isoprenylcysteine O-methyltransferase Ste14